MGDIHGHHDIRQVPVQQPAVWQVLDIQAGPGGHAGDTQTDSETVSQSARQSDRQQTVSKTDSQTVEQSGRHTKIHAYVETDIQTYRQTDIQTSDLCVQFRYNFKQSRGEVRIAREWSQRCSEEPGKLL